ncbi:hypothetical protein DL770_009851 [Monosporascus sp. CRB-9-2]|nr:hypothetical protein DL770_009851 [Monosporascus sp. CRB-9-2]
MLPFAVQALDATIIASALPWIARDFGEVPQMNWIISAFNLTNSAFMPLWGQIADIFGRHAAIHAVLVVMVVGSALCAGAPTTAYAILLVGRGVQGLGCAGLSVVIRVILADKVTLEEQATNWTIFSLVAGCSYGLGPAIGGYLTNASWRWCFGINLPICVISIALVFLLLRNELLGPLPVVDSHTPRGDLPRPDHKRLFFQRLRSIDFGGQILFLLGFGLLVLSFTWAGAIYGWDSVAVLLPLCLGMILSCAFLGWEYMLATGRRLSLIWPHQKAMLPWNLVSNRDISLLFYINFATGAAMYAVLYYVNLYFTMVRLQGANAAGIQLLYYAPGMGAGVYLAMRMCNHYPRQTFVPLILGSVLEAVGVAVLPWALYAEHTSVINGMMVLAGVGTGLRAMPGTLHGIGLFSNDVTAVVSLMAVALPFGGTVALTMMSSVFNNISGISETSPLRDFTVISGLPESTKAVVIHNAKIGLVWAFVSIVPLMVLSEEGELGLGNKVCRGIYLLELFRGRHNHQQTNVEELG